MLDYLKNRQIYSTTEREPFYEIVRQYLPSNKNEKIIDIGCGKGTLFEYLGLNQYPNVYMLDGEVKAIEYCKYERYGIPILWDASDPLPVPNSSISLLHCSHMIEHLSVSDLENIIVEINRVVKPGGFVVIAGPLLYTGFYEEITHIKPIPPNVFFQRLCYSGDDYECCSEPVSSNFLQIRLQYRWLRLPIHEGYQHNWYYLNFVLFGLKTVFRYLGFQKYIKSGYLLVLQKKGID